MKGLLKILQKNTITNGSLKELQGSVEYEDDLGNRKTIKGNQRFYIPSEINWLLKSLGYKRIDILGAKLGQFSREDKLTTKDFEMLVIADK